MSVKMKKKKPRAEGTCSRRALRMRSIAIHSGCARGSTWSESANRTRCNSSVPCCCEPRAISATHAASLFLSPVVRGCVGADRRVDTLIQTFEKQGSPAPVWLLDVASILHWQSATVQRYFAATPICLSDAAWILWIFFSFESLSAWTPTSFARADVRAEICRCSPSPPATLLQTRGRKSDHKCTSRENRPLLERPNDASAIYRCAFCQPAAVRRRALRSHQESS